MKRPGKAVLVSGVFAIVFGGVLGGLFLEYTTFFVTTEGLQDILAVPAIIIGLVAGWWCWLPTLVFLFVTSLLLLIRALVGRDMEGGYFWFAFALLVKPIWGFWFQTLLASYIGAFFRMIGVKGYRLAKKDDHKQVVDGG